MRSLFLAVEWHRPVFLHFELDPAIVRAVLPRPFALELFEERAIVSLVALTKRRFRVHPRAPWWARLVPFPGEQRFFNLRTYVRHGDEPGAFFFWSWLSRPWSLPLPGRPFGLACSFARSHYDHHHETGALRGTVTGDATAGAFTYRARPADGAGFRLCPKGSLAEFALERYAGYFWCRGAGRVFHVWHPPWRQTQVEAAITDDRLVTSAFPWLKDAHFVGAHYAPGFAEVWIGRPQRLPGGQTPPPNRHGSSALFRMP